MEPTNATAGYQTVKLSRGRHRRPEDGVCVMELSSMLAGEEFSDHPGSVSRVIAALLRTYNDLVNDVRRQDLYRYAAECVGTRSRRSVERARAEACRDWLSGRVKLTNGEKLRMRLLPISRRYAATAWVAARYAASSRAHHEAFLELVDRLTTLDAEPQPASTAARFELLPTQPAARARRA